MITDKKLDLPGPDQESWDRIVERIYDCALDESRWEQALHPIMDALSSNGAQLVTLGADQRSTLRNLLLLQDSETATREFEDFVSRGEHIRATWAFQNPHLDIMYDYQHTAEAEMPSNAFYQDFARPLRVDYYVASLVRHGSGHISALAMLREKRFGHYSQTEIDFLQRLRPHFQKALQLSGAIGRRNAIAGIEGVLSALQVGGIVVDRKMRILGMNEAGERAIEDAIGLRTMGATLHCESASMLQEVVSHTQPFSEPPPACGQGTERLAMRTSGRTPYRITCASFRVRQSFGEERPCLILIVDPEAPFCLSSNLLADAFGLTPAECSVVSMLVEGRPAALIAEARASSVATVRSQIKSAMKKSGCRKQSELVGRVMRYVALN
jgi:DNA-binding CsgD family transcriptional regulator